MGQAALADPPGKADAGRIACPTGGREMANLQIRAKLGRQATLRLFQRDRPREEDVVFQVDVAMQVALHVLEFEVQYSERVTGIRRERISGRQLAHFA